MHEITVAVIGCGFVANDHLKAWRKLRSARVVAVADLNETLARSAAKFWKIHHYYKSLDELMRARESVNIDLVDICTPPQTHAIIAVEAMKNGFSVLIEKPMTMTAKDAEKIVECQRSTGAKAGVIHNWLFEPSVLEAISVVRKGSIGEVFNVEIEALSPIDDSMAANRRHWSHSLPGGRFSEMLAHPIYLIRHFLGNEIELGEVQVSRIGDYAWMKSDELCATFRVGKKIGRVYASFNASREAIFVSLYGREAILKLDIINSTVNVLPRRRTDRFGKGFDSLRQATQLANWTIRNTSKILSKRWLSGHDLYIRLFAESLIHNSEPPVTVKDGHAVIMTLERMCDKIEETERKYEEVNKVSASISRALSTPSVMHATNRDRLKG